MEDNERETLQGGREEEQLGEPDGEKQGEKLGPHRNDA